MISPDAIWSVLVKECAAPEHLRADFLHRVKEHQNRSDRFEFRFCGSLGFGGKLYQGGPHLYVSAYPEDMTPDRVQVIARANAALAKIER